ncbi:MAG: flagellar biosynthesis anti-sigma factor FlgM [Planctomycetaceae bacterium]|nr:flagellar biosynthesis anti-sigma factor FlgM [Planctomycetaceae bacterium]
MDVNGPSPIRPSTPIQPTQQAGSIQDAAASDAVAPKDDVEISQAARMMEELDQASDLHQARLDRIKEDIKSGVYETPEKLESALWNLLKEIETE